MGSGSTFSEWPWTAWALLPASYLLGSIPFGFVLTRVVKGIDVRTVGSGNIGATNAARAMGRGWGVVVGVLDALKGLVPTVLLAPLVLEPGQGRLVLALLAGLGAVLGHCFPVWLSFRGGKGVATAGGAVLGIDPVVFLWGAATWIVALLATRYVGLASILMTGAFAVAALALRRETPLFATLAGLVFLLILLRHRANLVRMIAGTEPRIGAKKAG